MLNLRHCHRGDLESDAGLVTENYMTIALVLYGGRDNLNVKFPHHRYLVEALQRRGHRVDGGRPALEGSTAPASSRTSCWPRPCRRGPGSSCRTNADPSPPALQLLNPPPEQDFHREHRPPGSLPPTPPPLVQSRLPATGARLSSNGGCVHFQERRHP